MRLAHRDRGPGFTHQDGPDCACRPVKVRTSFDYPPIPLRQFDWSAVTDDYDGAPDAGPQPEGWGVSEEAAVDDLMAQIED